MVDELEVEGSSPDRSGVGKSGRSEKLTDEALWQRYELSVSLSRLMNLMVPAIAARRSSLLTHLLTHSLEVATTHQDLEQRADESVRVALHVCVREPAR